MADVAARDGGQGLWIAECLIGKQRAWGLALSVMEEWETENREMNIEHRTSNIGH
jgi:hypothetical protein